MKVKDLLNMLKSFDLEADVLINDNGSILATADIDENVNYNKENDSGLNEFYIVTSEWW